MKTIKIFVLTLSMSISFGLFSQTTTCNTYTPCVPVQNTDLLQVMGLLQQIKLLLAGGSPTVSDFKDNSQDSITNKLERVAIYNDVIAQRLMSGSISISDWIVLINGSLNTTNNYLSGLYDLRFTQNYQKMDSMLTKITDCYTKLTSTLTVNSSTINVALQNINNKLNNQFGNYPSSTISHTVLMASDPASLDTEIDNFLSASSFPTIISASYAAHAGALGDAHSVLIWYRP